MLHLLSHPQTSPNAKLALTASIERTATCLNLTYMLSGAVDAVLFADETLPDRTDGLWKTTCFEVFAMPQGQGPYIEYNFSPSFQWAAYRFSSYRDGMSHLALAHAPQIERVQEGDAFILRATAILPREWDGQSLHLNISAVIEEKDGTKSYWALKHPDGAPDFHDPACFILERKAPDAT